jgi:hypothetical protein
MMRPEVELETLTPEEVEQLRAMMPPTLPLSSFWDVACQTCGVPSCAGCVRAIREDMEDAQP